MVRVLGVVVRLLVCPLQQRGRRLVSSWRQRKAQRDLARRVLGETLDPEAAADAGVGLRPPGLLERKPMSLIALQQ